MFWQSILFWGGFSVGIFFGAMFIVLVLAQWAMTKGTGQNEKKG